MDSNSVVDLSRLTTKRKVFCIGANKTGTTSLTTALNTIGFKTSHWEHHNSICDDIKNNNFKLTVLNTYDGVSDNPIPAIYKQLDKEFPESKFILTIRNEENWIKSIEGQLSRRRIRNSCEEDKLVYEEFLFYGIWNYDRTTFLHRYREHNKDVLEYFKSRPHDLLVMDLDKVVGWKEICTFLEISNVPSTDFPHLFQTTKIKSTFLVGNEVVIDYY